MWPARGTGRKMAPALCCDDLTKAEELDNFGFIGVSPSRLAGKMPVALEEPWRRLARLGCYK